VTSAPAESPPTGSAPLLEVEGLSCEFDRDGEIAQVLRDIHLTLDAGVSLGLVGESGSGKSMLMKSIMGIAPRSARISGRVRLDGTELTSLTPPQQRRLVGRKVGIVFQNPMTSLNPVVRVGRQVGEATRFHLGLSRAAAHDRALSLMQAVGLPDAEQCYRQYPHQFSGGMKQRLMIAAALACEPELLIADEATTALDVTVQRNILDLLHRLKAERDMALIVVTHNLGIVAGRSEKVAVMYGGRIVEYGATAEVFKQPRHRYTQALLKAIPRTDDATQSRLVTIPGRPPVILKPTPGCPFAPRCGYAQSRCHAEDPPTVTVGTQGHTYTCFVPVEDNATQGQPDDHIQ